MKIVMAEHSHYHSLYRVGCHHLAEYFTSQGHEVLYISGPMNIFSLRYLITGNPSQHDLRYGLSTWVRGGIWEKPNLLSYAPITLIPIWRKSIFASYWVAHNTLKFTLPNLARYIARHGFGQPNALLVSQPFFAELLETILARVKVYRLTDDIDRFSNIPASVRKVEKEAARRADAVVVTSTPLIEKVNSYEVQNILYVPNGVDYAHYQQVAAKPAEYARLTGPIVLYMGAIDAWFDVETLAYCARALPQANFVLIGAPRIDLSAVQGLLNVRCLGRRAYTDLPAYLQHASVGIIPFKVTPLIEAVSPLKLYEYMACGLAVVASRWRELEHIASPAYLADDKEAFLAGLTSALSEDKAKRHLYQEFAARNSWQRRGRQLEDLFTAMLEDRVSNAG